MSDQCTDETERLLEEDERSVQLAVDNYQDTELEVRLKGPKVTDDEYRERLTVTKLAQDGGGLHGWQKLAIPADNEVLGDFISVLIQASNALHNLEEDHCVDTDTDRQPGAEGDGCR